MKVPQNKRVYIGRRKFFEGDELPHNIYFGFPEIVKEKVEEPEEQKKPGRPRKTERENDIFARNS